VRAAFFDLDGTLADTRVDIASTVNHARRDLGLEELPVATVVANVGCGARHLLEHSIPEAPVPYEELKGMFLGHYAEHCTETVSLYPGVEETLDELARRGWRMGVVTNKPRVAVMPILEKFSLLRHFGDAVVAGGDCVELKPSPAPLAECAVRMGADRVSAGDWMIGDNWTDMRCAENAGVNGLFCGFGFGRLDDASFDAKADCFPDILRYLKAGR